MLSVSRLVVDDTAHPDIAIRHPSENTPVEWISGVVSGEPSVSAIEITI